MKRLQDKIIMITGASSGFGQALSIACAKEGASILAVGRKEDALQTTQESVEAVGGRCLAIPFDLTQFDAYTGLVDALKEQVPHLDAVVHAAGAFDRCAPMAYVKPAEFRKMLDHHLTVPNLLTQALLPLLDRSAHASVLFLACEMSTEPAANWHAYGLAKAALVSAASMWQQEFVDKPYRFAAIDPGRMRTPLMQRAWGGLHPKTIPLPAEACEAFIRVLEDHSDRWCGDCVEAKEIMA